MVNKKIRNMIKDNYDILNSITGNSDVSKIILINNIISLKDSDNKEDYIKYYLSVSVLFSDLYKKLNLKKRLNILNEEDIIVFQILNNYNNLDNFINDSSRDIGLLAQLIEATLDFNELSILGKMNLMKSLNEEEVLYLNNICPTFYYDKDSYDKDFSCEQYYKFFKNINKNHRKNHINTINSIKLITDYINNLGINRKEEFKKIVKEYYIFYDKVCGYLNSKYLLDEDEKKTFDIIHDFTVENIDLYVKKDNKILDVLVSFNIYMNEIKKDNKYCMGDIYFSDEDADLVYNSFVKKKEK